MDSYFRFPFKDVLIHEYFQLAEYPVIAFLIAVGVYLLFKATAGRRYLFPVPVFLVASIVLFLSVRQPA